LSWRETVKNIAKKQSYTQDTYESNKKDIHLVIIFTKLAWWKCKSTSAAFPSVFWFFVSKTLEIFFIYFKLINIFLMFLDHFNMSVLKIIFKK
jgi:hypothetical protein